MRGLIEKDIRLMLKKKQVIFIIIAVEILLMLRGMGTFGVSYFTMLAGILAAGTLSYDEFDNGFAFLFTLPIDRKIYIKEKYVLCAASCIVFWCASVALFYLRVLIGGEGMSFASQLPWLFITLPGMIMLTTTMLPFQLQFGSETGKIILFVICGGLGAIVMFVQKMFFSTEEDVIKLINFFTGLSMVTAILGFIAVCALIICVTYSCSVRIMSKKEL